MNAQTLRRILFIFVSVLLAALSVAAQAPAEEVGRLELAGVDALAVTGDGSFLVAANTQDQTVQFIDLADVTRLEALDPVGLYGEPVALAAAADFALVLADPGGTRQVEVVGQDPRREEYYIARNFIDVPATSFSISMARDGDWALVQSAEDYVILELLAADDINIIPSNDSGAPLVDAVLFDDTAVLAREGSAILETRALQSAEVQTQSATANNVGAQVTAMTLSADSDLIAAATEDGSVLLIDPLSLAVEGSVALDGPIAALEFVTSNSGRSLVAVVDGQRTTIEWFDVSDPANPAALDALTTEQPIRALTTTDEYIIISDGTQIIVYQASV